MESYGLWEEQGHRSWPKFGGFTNRRKASVVGLASVSPFVRLEDWTRQL